MAATGGSLFQPHRGPILPAFERLAPPPVEGVVVAEIEARTAPGDVIIEPHGRGGWIARSAVDRLRRVFVVESSALTSLQAELLLRPPDLRHLDAAVSAMAVMPNGRMGLRQSIMEAFSSRCASCGRSVVVDEFLWEPRARAPVRKSYRCDRCRDRSRSAEGRPVPVDQTDVARALEMWEQGSPERRVLRLRFPTPDEDHPLPDQLLDLYTPRSLDAIGALVERLDLDLRAAPIEAALRLALVHLLLPASRLNRHMGRPQALRIGGGRMRPATDSAWRERNPWLLFEEGVRAVRAFVLRLDGAPQASVMARPGHDLPSLLDGSANVVLRLGSAGVGSVGQRSRVRLVLTQPPIHWSPENLAFAYLATSLALGRDAALTLPTEAIFGAALGSEWSWDVAAMSRSLAGVLPALAAEARVIVLLDPTGPSGLAASVLGGVGAGLRLQGAVLTEVGDQLGGTLDFAPAPRADDRNEPSSTNEEPITLAVAEAAVTEVAVGVLQARGEPARFDRLLGEVLVGLDRLGYLRRLVSSRPFAETAQRAGLAAERMGVLAPPAPENAAHRDGERPAGGDSSFRAHSRSIRQPIPVTVGVGGGPPTPDPAPSLLEEVDGGQDDVGADDWERLADGGSDPVRLLLDVVMGEIRRPQHPRLMELEAGQFWLRDPRDAAAAGVPLADRLEWAVFSLLATSGGLPESSFMARISGMFRAHDMPDEELVRACLASYRVEDGPTTQVMTADTLRDRYEEHGNLVGMLTEYGHRLGMRCWISRHEQKRIFREAPLAALLSEVEGRVYLPLVTAGEQASLEAVDCIWYVRGKASFLFEVEWTAMLWEPLIHRGSRIPTTDSMVRFLVIPPERTELVRLKLARSPILRGAVADGNWHILKSNHLRRLHARPEADLGDLEPLLGLDPEIERQGEQLALFG